MNARRGGLWRTAKIVAAFMPTILATLYFGAFASDRYVSEAKFVVRSASRPAGGAGLGALLQMTGLSRAQDEVFAVHSFLTSRSAVERLLARLPLRDYYGHREADWIARYPSPIFGPSAEDFYRYFNYMISTAYNSTTGITTLRVQAFGAQDAKAVADALLDLGEQTVNQMNDRIYRDAIRVAAAEVSQNQDDLISSQQELTRFRNSELMIDPAGSSVIVTELIGKLGADLAQTEAVMREMSAASAASPQIASQRQRAEALQAQIARERARISDKSEGLASKLATYERLVLDREFAKQKLATSVRSLESAQAESRRQQLYLERVVEPVIADKAMAPERLRMIASSMGLNLIFAITGWLVVSGLREHEAQR
ncbi:MAG: capsule biosynthesis protein [Hyphomicrobiaceae bacterium]